jgi:hypothetical protein
MTKIYLIGEEKDRSEALRVADGFLPAPLEYDALAVVFPAIEYRWRNFLVVVRPEASLSNDPTLRVIDMYSIFDNGGNFSFHTTDTVLDAYRKKFHDIDVILITPGIDFEFVGRIRRLQKVMVQ